MKHIDRTGEIGYNNFGSKIIIVEYINNENIIVEFENGYKVKNRYINFKKGNIASPYERRTLGIGYLGEGNYSTKINGEKTKTYLCWSNMLKRCYKYYIGKSNYVYKDCVVCDEWHNFQNFSKWFEENYYEIPNCKMELDKDILVKDNKIYSPETCCFVPRIINTLFTKSNKTRGKYPIGVSFNKDTNKFVASCNVLGKQIKRFTGYDCPEEAFYIYKNFKENLIKQVADQYKIYIPEKLYNAMYNYKVEITD